MYCLDWIVWICPTRDVKNGMFCCYVLHVSLIGSVKGMPWPVHWCHSLPYKVRTKFRQSKNLLSVGFYLLNPIFYRERLRIIFHLNRIMPLGFLDDNLKSKWTHLGIRFILTTKITISNKSLLCFYTCKDQWFQLIQFYYEP